MRQAESRISDCMADVLLNTRMSQEEDLDEIPLENQLDPEGPQPIEGGGNLEDR